MRYYNIIESNDAVLKLITGFTNANPDYIAYGCIRGNCGTVAADFVVYGQKHGIDIKRVSGTFKTEIPSNTIEDFTDEEIDKMEQQGFDSSQQADRYEFATDNNIIDELLHIPHYWNEYNGKIIDFTGKSQFVDTGLSPDINPERYHTD